EALEGNRSSGPQRERGPGSDQPAYDAGNQELAGGSSGANAGLNVDGGPDEVAFLRNGFAGVDADTDVDRQIGLGRGLRGRFLQDRGATGDRKASRRKGDEDGVPFHFDFRACEFTDALTDELSVFPHQSG